MAREFIATAYERATQMTPTLYFQDYRQTGWMAHTPVGHDSLLYADSYSTNLLIHTLRNETWLSGLP